MDEFDEEIEYNEDEYDITEIVVEENDDQKMIEILRKYNKHKRKYQTNPILTKYEKCRVYRRKSDKLWWSDIYIKYRKFHECL